MAERGPLATQDLRSRRGEGGRQGLSQHGHRPLLRAHHVQGYRPHRNHRLRCREALARQHLGTVRPALADQRRGRAQPYPAAHQRVEPEGGRLHDPQRVQPSHLEIRRQRTECRHKLRPHLLSQHLHAAVHRAVVLAELRAPDEARVPGVPGRTGERLRREEPRGRQYGGQPSGEAVRRRLQDTALRLPHPRLDGEPEEPQTIRHGRVLQEILRGLEHVPHPLRRHHARCTADGSARTDLRARTDRPRA